MRESFCLIQPKDPETYHFGFKDGSHSINAASEKYNYHSPNIWKPSIHMPKEACRIFLEVVNVKTEKLRDILHYDARAEGIDFIEGLTHKLYYNYLTLDYGCTELFSFMTLWEKINGSKSWEENPFVWVYEFKIIDKPKDF